MLDKVVDKIDKKTIIFLMIFFAVIIFSLIKDYIPFESHEYEISNETLIGLFEKLDNNYTMNVSIDKNGVSEKYTYYTDSFLELYEINETDGYIKYNNSFYKVDPNDYYKIDKVNDVSFDDKYTNVKLIKALIPYCDYRVINSVNVECKIKVKDYINEYNKLYNSEVPYTDDNIVMRINHIDNYLSFIEIDYSNVSGLIYNNSENVKYKMDFENVGRNNFDELKNMYKDSLK